MTEPAMPMLSYLQVSIALAFLVGAIVGYIVRVVVAELRGAR